MSASATLPSAPATRPSPAPARRPRTARPDHRRWRDGPTPASLADLVALTREVADEIADGRHPSPDPVHRCSTRLYAEAHLDVWLVGWAAEQATELHDHGGSLGALTVVAGSLTEWRWTAGAQPGHVEELATAGPGLRRHVLGTGSAAGFGLGHVHDVGNRSSEPAVSVHAHSPPLSAVSYYAVEGGALTRTRSELVHDGRPPA